MSDSGELLLLNLISSYKGRHELYKSKYSDFGVLFGLLVLGGISVPILGVIMWFIDDKDLLSNITSAISILLIYAIGVGSMYWGILKSRKRLNEIKNQLESGGFRICLRSEEQNISCLDIVAASKINKTHKLLVPFKKIDFKKYHQLFEIW